MDERRPLLRAHPEPTQGSSDEDTKPLDFDPEGDADDPLQWPKSYKWGLVALQAFMSFTVTFTCISVVPVASEIMDDVSSGHASKQAAVLLVTIWELGEAAGPLLIAPLSEVFGRYPVFNVANVLFIVGVALSAVSQSAGLLIFARFLTGCAVASNVLNPAVVGDMFKSEERGSPMSMIMLAPLLGGAGGPAIAGAIAQSVGWRMIMWMSLILATVCELLFLMLFRETYKTAILQKKAARLRDEGAESLETTLKHEAEQTESAVLTAILRPAKVFYSSFVLQAMSVQGAVVFSFFYVMSTTLPDILKNVYHFPPALVGTSFMSFSVGSLVGVVVCNFSVDRIYKYLQQKHGVSDKPQPEYRLPLVIAGAVALPFAVALYGWTAQEYWPVALQLVAVALLGFFCISALVPMMAYVVDATGLYSASAMTAVLITRCLMGTFLPMAAVPLTDELGYGVGFTILGAVCLALAPVPILMMRYGGRWRQRSDYTKDQPSEATTI